MTGEEPTASPASNAESRALTAHRLHPPSGPQACVARIEAKGHGECEPYYFDFLKCVDKHVCAAARRGSRVTREVFSTLHRARRATPSLPRRPGR